MVQTIRPVCPHAVFWQVHLTHWLNKAPDLKHVHINITSLITYLNPSINIMLAYTLPWTNNPYYFSNCLDTNTEWQIALQQSQHTYMGLSYIVHVRCVLDYRMYFNLFMYVFDFCLTSHWAVFWFNKDVTLPSSVWCKNRETPLKETLRYFRSLYNSGAPLLERPLNSILY